MVEVNNFVNDFMVRLDGKVADKDLKLIQSELNIMLSNYEIKERETSLVPLEGYLPPCYQMFMVTKKIEGRTEATLSQYKYQLERFFLQVSKPVEQITKEDIVLYLYKMEQHGASGKPLSATSVDNIRLCLNNFFSWSFQNGYLAKNPCATIGRIKGEVKPREPLNETEIETLRDAIIHYNIDKNTPADRLIRARDLALFEFLYSTGCRLSEVVDLNRADIDTLSNPPVVSVFGKGQKHRKSYMNSKAMYCMNQYLALRTDDDPRIILQCPLPI